MISTEIDKFFPFKEYWDNQRETLLKIVNSFNSGKKIVIVGAPVGFGKSPIGVTIGKMFNTTYYITPQKILQNQLGKDFSDSEFAVVKGRNNFRCLNNEEHCDCGQCILEGKKQISEEFKDKVLEDSFCMINPVDFSCPYKYQRDIGAKTKICNMNFAYFLVANREMFGKREILIIDEAHSIADWALNFVSVTISTSDILIIKNIPDYNNFESYILWLDSEILPMINDLYDSLPSVLNSDEKKLEIKLESLINKISKLKDDYYINKEDWVWNIENEGKNKSIKFQPVTVGRFMKDLIWSRAENILLMSATILDPDMFLEEVGLENEKYDFIPVPSNYHYQYNPVMFYPVGKMTKDFKSDTLPKMVDKIREIISKHGEEKGIIHCHTYDIAEYIYQNLYDINYRLILQRKNNREYCLNKFMESKNSIFISVNMNEGIDLKGDLARYQIVLKVPYLFMGDKRISVRVNDRQEYKWYNLQAIKILCQAYGRAQRNEEDWAVFYILDESFEGLWNRYKEYFTTEFKNSYIYGKMLIAAEGIDILPKIINK